MLKKIIILSSLIATSLFAQEASQEQLNNIYQEAILFVVIFGLMGLVSYIYSSRHAKQYVPKGLTQEEIEERAFRENRVQKLSKLFDEKVLLEDEFLILKQHYIVN